MKIKTYKTLISKYGSFSGARKSSFWERLKRWIWR
jgi:hypothetical protein